MHSCNLFNNLRPNGHLSTKPKLDAFFGTGAICILLFSSIIPKYRFYANLVVFLVFYYEHRSI